MNLAEVPGGNRMYPLEMYDLPEEFVRKAEVELNETPENRIKFMRQLRELVENDNKLISSWLSDDFLLMFLRCRKFDVQRAFSSLQRSLTFMKTRKKYFYIKQHIVEINNREKTISFLPYRDKDGCAVCVFRLNRWDPSAADPDDCIPYHILLLFTGMSYPMSQVNGIKLLIDFNVNTAKYIRYCTPHYVRLIYQVFQEVVPARLKCLHIINPNFFFRLFHSILSNFMPEKLMKRVIVHRHVSELKNYFPESLIPDFFGGRLEDYDISEWIAKAKFPEIVGHLSGVHGPQKPKRK